MPYVVHQDVGLQQAFANKAYQGAAPDEAEFVFCGLDANFAPNIASHPVYQGVLEYLKDGVAYWQHHRIHHPFLRDDYGQDGAPYHRTFATLGLTRADAHRIAFVELIAVPTSGRSKLAVADLEPLHLERLRSWLIDGSARAVFVSRQVARLLRQSGMFPELKRPAEPTDSGLLGWALRPRCDVLRHYHFSAHGWQYEQLRKDLACIKSVVQPHPPRAED